MKLLKYLWILLLFLFSLINIYSISVYDTDLTAYWEGENDFTDTTTYNRDLTNSGIVFGSGGDCRDGNTNCFNLDNTNDYAYINYFEPADTNNAIYFSAWIKYVGAGYLLVKDQSGSRCYGMSVSSGGELTVETFNTAGSTYRVLTSSGGTLNSGNWEHIYVEMSSSSTTIYQDNSIIGTSSATSGTMETSCSSQTRIGARGFSGPSTDAFTGYVQDISMWNRSLIGSDLTDLYNNGISLIAIETNLSAFYSTPNFSISLDALDGSEGNMSYILDGGSEIDIADNTNSSTLSLSGLTIGNHNLSLKFEQGGAIIWNNQTFSIQPNQYFRFYDTENAQYITDYTFGGVSSVGQYVTLNYSHLDFRSNSVPFTKTGYMDSNYDVTFNNTAQLNITYNVNISKIILNIYDGVSGQYITDLSTVTLISSIGYNASTSTGKLNISNINFLSEEYQIIVESADYTTETVYFTYTNQEILTKNIFLLNSSNPNLGYINVLVSADTGQLVSGALCKALQWKPIENSYVSVSEGLTNSNGIAQLNILLNVNLYKFQCSKSGQTVTSSSQIITSTAQTLPLELSTGGVAPVYTLGSLTYTFTNSTYNSTHQTITFSYQDTKNLVTQACINTYKVVGTKKTPISVGVSCVSSSSGILYKIINVNNTYNVEAVASVSVNSISTTIDTIVFKGTSDISNTLKQYNLDILLPLLFLLLGFIMGLSLQPQNIFLAVAGGVIMTWLSVAIVPTVISSSIAIFITLIGVAMFYGGQR